MERRAFPPVPTISVVAVFEFKICLLNPERQMNIPETYNYLVRARHDLWAVLEALPDEVLSRQLP